MAEDTINAINISRKVNINLLHEDSIDNFEEKFQPLYNCQAKDIVQQRKRLGTVL